MEFLLGRILEDAVNNLGLEDEAKEALAVYGVNFADVVGDEPDAALGNGGLGRLAACFLDSLSCLGIPAYGYGIRYAHGLFRQSFEDGRQTEMAEDWLRHQHNWEFERSECLYDIGFGGKVYERGNTAVWTPTEIVMAQAYDTPVPGWRASWTNTLRLWSAKPKKIFDLDPFNRGEYMQAAAPEVLAETISRVLYPDAHPMEHEGATGVHFAVWAPAASRVSVVGEFNQWDGRRNVMRARGSTGIWEIFIPDLGEGTVYKYEIRDGAGDVLPLKADPVGFGAEHPPATASVVRDLNGFDWSDAQWMTTRANRNRHDQPVSIYEVHLGSWRRKVEDGDRPLSYLEFATELVDYVRDMGFTHIELMPISEFPFDGSWGYQPIGLFAPTIRFGTPDEFRAFVNAAHVAGLGVLLDWVPGHFPTDQHGLGQFDGSSLYEHADPREGFHQDWNTLIYNYGRREVQNFLVANALYWIKEFHIDGLRVDAVASMLYRDYSRKDDEWIPNEHGGRENFEAIAFLQRTNALVYDADAGILMAAEESTSFPGVSKPVDQGGLGFGFKWNMGWMNDTLDYMGRDPVHRSHHHHQMTFGLTYAFSENFILPISHDEVVHGKGSMLSKMPGEGFDQFAGLRSYYGFMWGHPGKKLLFMGQEFAQGAEWNHERSLDWHLLDHAWHRGTQGWVKALNAFYKETPTLFATDSDPTGFYWLEVDQSDLSVYAWVRQGKDGQDPVIVVCNMTPTPRDGHRLGVPNAGRWEAVLNSNAKDFGGSGHGPSVCTSEDIAWSGQSQSICFDLPGNTTLFFRLGK